MTDDEIDGVVSELLRKRFADVGFDHSTVKSGPLIAIMGALHDNFRLVFWLALIPGLLSVLVLALGVREPQHQATTSQAPLTFADLKTAGAAYWKSWWASALC